MRNTQMEIRPISGALGAEIFGVDLTAGVNDETFDRIRGAFLDHGVIVVRDQNLTPEQHLAAARRFGKINVNRFFTPVDGHPEVAEVRKEPDQKRNIGSKWHTDHSYDDVPALGSMIYALEKLRWLVWPEMTETHRRAASWYGDAYAARVGDEGAGAVG